MMDDGCQRGVTTLTEAWSSFIYRPKLRLTIMEYPSPPSQSPPGPPSQYAPPEPSACGDWIDVYHDENVAVKALTVGLFPLLTGQKRSFEGQSVTPLNNSGPTVNSHFPGQDLIYLVTLVYTPGKFNPQKALSLGIARGPLFSKLCKGESVEVSVNGSVKVVTPEEVISPSVPGHQFLIIDVWMMDDG